MLTMSRRVIAITAQGCDCYHASGRRLVLEARFPPGETDAFEAFIRSRSGSVFCALADVIEEDFRQDTMPFLRGPARGRLLARKSGQIYRDTPFHTTASLGRESEGRRDERVQLLGLTNAEVLNQWLTPLSAAGVRVAGLYSPPVAAAELLRLLGKRIGVRPPRLLVVSIDRAGLRQTLIDGEVARFSRLAAVPAGTSEDFAADCLAEVSKTQQYLVGLRLLARDAALPALILVPPGEEAQWSRPGLLVDAVQAIFVDIAAARRAAGLGRVDDRVGGEDEARFADSLWVHTVARRRPRLDFAPDWLRERFRLWQARVALLAGGALVMLAGLGIGLDRFAQSEVLARDARRLAVESSRNELNYERIKSGFPPLPAAPEQLKASVSSFEKLAERAIAPAAFLAEVGQVLDKVPEFRLQRLEWRQGSGDPLEPAAAAQGVAGADPAAADRFEWISLLGQLDGGGSAADARRELEIAQRAAEALRAIRGARVVIVRSPIDISPRGRLAGTGAAEPGSANAGAQGATDVEIRVARKVGK